MVGVHMAIGSLLVTKWSPTQVSVSTGLNQLFVFSDKYYVVLIGLLAVWAFLFLGLVRSLGARQVVGGLPFHLCIIAAAAVVLLPGTVLIPGFSFAVSYLGERMSLGVAVCVCALLAGVQPRALERYALLVLAIVFFGFVYRDERARNAFEDRMQDVISVVTDGSRAAAGYNR